LDNLIPKIGRVGHNILLYSLKCHYYPIKEIRCKEMVLTIEDISAILYMR
jgi:hypothetical protein